MSAISGRSGAGVLILGFLLMFSGASVAFTGAAVGPTEFPAIPGWTLTINPTLYTPQNLWDLIDGAADLFLAYEFIELKIGEYRDMRGMAIRVELYRHASGQDAFGMYAAERQRDYRFIEIGTQGYSEDGVLNFLTGEYYVKLSTSESGPEGLRALTDVAGRVARHLNRPARWPEELRLLPQKGRISNSEGFVRKDFLGYSFLRSAFTARYQADQEIQLFVIRAESAESAKRMAERVLQAAAWKAPLASDGVTVVNDPNNGPLTLLQTGRFLGGIIGSVNPSTRDAYISRLKESLKPSL